MTREELVKLQKLLHECMQGEKDTIQDSHNLHYEASVSEAYSRINIIVRRWCDMRIEAAEERLEWLRREFDASTMVKPQ